MIEAIFEMIIDFASWMIKMWLYFIVMGVIVTFIEAWAENQTNKRKK